MASKLELDVRQLIAHCEELVKEDPNSWRLKKYIKSLDTMISELESIVYDVSNNKVIDEYVLRCNSLKKLINYIPESSSILQQKKKLSKTQMRTDVHNSGDSLIKEIKQIHNSKYDNELRSELFGSTGDSDSATSGLRKRGVLGLDKSTGENGNNSSEMSQAALKYYDDAQERIAEDMLILTRNLREQTETANKIILKDTEVVTNSTNLTEKNILSLSKEAEKLQDHSKRACKCWLWMMLGIVMLIFIFMVLFIKIMKKKASPI